jgi:hypothetical protein
MRKKPEGVVDLIIQPPTWQLNSPEALTTTTSHVDQLPRITLQILLKGQPYVCNILYRTGTRQPWNHY